MDANRRAAFGGRVPYSSEALEDGVRVFSLGLDSLGFRNYCQQMVNALDQGVAGTEFTRPAKRDWSFNA